MKWANFLHIYQPPTQKEIWVRRIADESYRKIVNGLLETPEARLTININGILCELLEKYGGRDIIDKLKVLLERGTIELTGSAKYHAFLPLLPESEIKRQILLNEETLKKYFGEAWKKKGFFSPEMAYSAKVARVAKSLGYEWIMADELAFPQSRQKSSNKAYSIESVPGMKVFFRERNLSFIILSAQAGTVPTILRYLGDRLNHDEYAVTAMDGETFGHHRPGLETLLFDLFKEKSIEFVNISDLASSYPEEIIEPVDSTWAATRNDLKTNAPFARWKSLDNPVHMSQWELTEMAIEITSRETPDSETRKLLDSALHSDQYWWASARPWWSLEMIERGAHELKSLVLQAKTSTPEEKSKAEELYKNIIYTGFEWQRSGYVDEIARKEDEEVRERLEEKEKLFITKDDYAQMINTLEKQMRLAGNSEEYHRASMIKDRIRELTEEMKKAKE